VKTILTLYGSDDWHVDEPFENAGVVRMYEIWESIGKRKGFQIARASMEWFVNGAFTKYWHLSNGKWRKVKRRLKPTVIYDRSLVYDRKTGRIIHTDYLKKQEITKFVPIVNVPDFTRLMDNKLYQAAIYRDVMPDTVLVTPGTIVKNPTGKRIVLKALGGAGGRFVYITRAKRIKVTERMIKQTFLDAERDGRFEDFRIHFVGDRAMYIYTRVSQKGSVFTNVRKGAEFHFISFKDQPRVHKLALELHKRLSVFPKKIYAIDFMIERRTGKPNVIEVNSAPGMIASDNRRHEILMNETTKLLLG